MLFFGSKSKKINKEYDKTRIPVHIAIFMDGNGRWAKKRGMPRKVGHREGANTLRTISKFCNKIGIKYLTVYAFSTENWTRPKEEVDALMSLLLEYLRDIDNEIGDDNVRIRIIGDVGRLSEEIQKEIAVVNRKTEKNDGFNLIFALNYGGRDEIVHAVRDIAIKVKKGLLKEDEITENTVTNYLYTVGIPDPELVIRASGEKRISNFLLWQSAYSEFWFPNVLWPDFREEHIIEAIIEYQSRNRRYGGIKG
jgi:undecaprenyl diphosphate synthase